MQRLWFVKVRLVVLVSVLVALMAAAACGDDDTARAPVIDTEALSASEVSDIVAAALAEQAAAADKDKGTVVLTEKAWDAHMIENYIATKILTEEMGYEVEEKLLSGLAHWPALCTGEVDIELEMYTKNRPELVEEYVTEGGKECIERVASLGNVSQSQWYVPTYVIEGDEDRGIEAAAPDLKTWEDLSRYKELFAVVETAPKGRLLAGNPGWGQQPERIDGLGLQDDYVVVFAGSEAAQLAEMAGAIKKGEPFLTYLWVPHWAHRKWDMTAIELPEWYHGCELEEKFDCGMPLDELSIMANVELKDKMPEVYQFFQNWGDLTNEDMNGMLFDYDAGASYAEAADRWMDRNRAKWQAWIP